MADDKKFDFINGSVSIVSTGKKSVEKEEFEKVLDAPMVDAGVGNTLEELYDRFSRLIYVIDASGSMADGIAPDKGALEYDWTPEATKEAKEYILEAVASGEAILDPSSGVDLTEAKVRKLSADEVVEIIMENGWESEVGITPTVKPGTRMRGRSKMMAVKDAASDFVRQRFLKFPDAKVMVYSFEESPRLLSGGASEQQVLGAIDGLPQYGGGGTDIFKAVERAVGDCQKRAGTVGAHHIVLVSDALDYGAIRVQSLLQTMKQIGIVFDFIFIKGTTMMDEEAQSVVSALRRVCEETGGEFTTVTTEKDFVQKFLAASNRKCLPPAPMQLKGGGA